MVIAGRVVQLGCSAVTRWLYTTFIEYVLILTDLDMIACIKPVASELLQAQTRYIFHVS